MRARPSSITVRLTFGSPARPTSISSIVVEGGVAAAACVGADAAPAGAGDVASAAFAAHAARQRAPAATATTLVFMRPILGLGVPARGVHSFTMGCMVDRTLLLVDGSSYLYRAYHALPDLRGPGGVPTGAIRGVVSMMKLLREQYPAAHGACVFDDKGKTFRDDWYPEYKANRTAMPPDLALQIEPIIEAVKLLGWPVLTVPGIEADDAIGTISCMAAKGGFDVVISTGDKDLAQLVNERVTLINTMSNEKLDVSGVREKFGVGPEQIVDYLALIGDSVDNIPGVDKVGPKTAAKWIAEHGSLEGVIAAAPQMKGVVGENLRKALDWLPQGRRLVAVVTDCDLSGHVLGWPEFDALKLRDIEVDALLAFYDRYGFASMRKELETSVGRTPSARPAAGAAAARAPELDVP